MRKVTTISMWEKGKENLNEVTCGKSPRIVNDVRKERTRGQRDKTVKDTLVIYHEVKVRQAPKEVRLPPSHRTVANGANEQNKRNVRKGETYNQYRDKEISVERDIGRERNRCKEKSVKSSYSYTAI